MEQLRVDESAFPAIIKAPSPLFLPEFKRLFCGNIRSHLSVRPIDKSHVHRLLCEKMLKGII